MEINLIRAGVKDAKEIHAMQLEAFRELLDKYQDFDTSPGCEGVEKVEAVWDRISHITILSVWDCGR